MKPFMTALQRKYLQAADSTEVAAILEAVFAEGGKPFDAIGFGQFCPEDKPEDVRAAWTDYCAYLVESEKHMDICDHEWREDADHIEVCRYCGEERGERLEPCACGSGLDRYALHDGYGIFLTYACEKCEANDQQST